MEKFNFCWFYCGMAFYAVAVFALVYDICIQIHSRRIRKFSWTWNVQISHDSVDILNDHVKTVHDKEDAEAEKTAKL